MAILGNAWAFLRRYRFQIAPWLLFGGLAMTGYLNAVIGWTLFITAIILFASPVVERALGSKLTFDPFPKTPAKRKQIFVLNEPLSHLLAFVFIGIAVYAIAISGRHLINISIQVKSQSAQEATSQKTELITVTDKSLHDQRVVLDGYRYVRCKFTRVYFEFNGGPCEIEDCVVDTRHLGVESTNSAVMGALALLTTFRLLPPDVVSRPGYSGEKPFFPPFDKGT